MSQKRVKVVLINGSPKVGQISVSGLLISMQEEKMKDNQFDIYKIDVRKSMARKETENDYLAMMQADAIIFTFPLYIFCLPGLMMRFLQDFTEFRTANNDIKDKKVYAVVNCGFPEAWINREAVDVIKSFSHSINATFRFGVLIGGGGMLIGAKDKRRTRKTMEQVSGSFMLISEDIKTGSKNKLEDVVLPVKFFHKLYYLMGNIGWVYMAKKNGLKMIDLYRRPYQVSLAK
jgi:putative NADPH-quinone reductase